MPSETENRTYGDQYLAEAESHELSHPTHPVRILVSDRIFLSIILSFLQFAR